MNKKLKKRLNKMEGMVDRLETLDWHCREADRLRAKLIKQEEKLLKKLDSKW